MVVVAVAVLGGEARRGSLSESREEGNDRELIKGSGSEVKGIADEPKERRLVTRFGPFVLWSPPFALSPEIVRSGSISTTFVGCSSEEEGEKSSCVDEEAGTVEGIPLRCRRSVDGRDVRGFEKKMICQRPSFRSCGKHPTDEPSGRELCMQVLWPCVRAF